MRRDSPGQQDTAETRIASFLRSVTTPTSIKTALLAIALLYLVGLAVMPPEGLTHHDTGAKYLQVRNLRITMSGLDYSINYPARNLDPTLQWVPFQEKQYYIDYREGQDHGLIYLQWPIFLGLLTRIPWKVLGFWGLYVVPFLGGIGVCWATFRLALALGVPRLVGWVAAPLVGLATPLAIYSLLFFEHTLAAMLVALSLLFAARSVTGGGRHAMALSAVALAVAVYFRSELYVLAAVMGLVYALLALRWRDWRACLLVWVGAFALALVPLWAFYAITEGTLLPLHATWYFAGSSGVGEAAPGQSGGLELPALRYIVTAGWRVVPDFLFGPQTFPSSPIFPVWVGVLGVGGMILCALAAFGRGLARRWARLGDWWQAWAFLIGMASVCVASLAVALLPQSYHNLHGFVLASPFVALALWPPDKIVTQDGISAHGLVYVITLAYIVLHALIISALSGLGPISRAEWGQRYLLAAYPGLVALAMAAAVRLWNTELGKLAANAETRRRFKIAFATVTLALVGVGLAFTIRGYGVLYYEKTQVKAWQDLASALPDREPLVTDDWWLPLNLAAVFYSRPIMLASDDRLAQWAGGMQQRGVAEFALMSDRPSVFEGAWRSSVPSLEPVNGLVEVRGIWLQRFRFTGP